MFYPHLVYDYYYDINSNKINLDDNLYYTTEELREKIIATDTFYKVRSLPLKYSAGEDGEILDLTDVLSNLEQQPALPADELTHHSLTGTTALMYNQRLHLGSITRHLAPPFPFEFFKVYAQGAQYVGTEYEDYFGKRYEFPFIKVSEITNYRIQVTISTPEGEKYTDVTPGDDLVRWNLYSPYLSYPDNRATRLTIYWDGTGDFNPISRTLSLTPHPSLNLAYFLSRDLSPFPYFPSWDINYQYKTPPPNPTPQDADLNVLRVSEVGNPYFFPAKNTYSFGAPIIAMAPNTAPLSTGQFGQHPLYAFTEDGIYALGTGSGAITYDNVVPVSRDICTNPHLLQTDNAIVFITAQGLMSIRGSVVENLSEAINTGTTEDFQGDLRTVVTHQPIIHSQYPIVRLEPLLDYLPTRELRPTGQVFETTLGYNYAEREIYVHNKSYGYTYVLNLNSGQWHVFHLGYNNSRYKALDGFIENTYSTLKGYAGDALINFGVPQLNTFETAIYISRPIKFDTFELKRVKNAGLRCFAKNATSSHFYVFGSNDTVTWGGIISSCAQPADGQPIQIADHVAKQFYRTGHCKYLRVVYAVRAMPGTSMSLAQLDVDSVFTTKLR